MGNFHRGIRAAGIHHHNFFREALHRFQQARQIVRFVQGDDANAEPVHLCVKWLPAGASISHASEAATLVTPD
jgi:hypothetical protein